MPSESQSVGCTIEGLDEINVMLNSLATDGAEKAARRALREAAKVVQAAIVQRAPVRTDVDDGGTLSGTALPPGALKADIVIGNVRKGADGTMQIVIAPGKFTNHVARWVEYGHSEGKRGKKGRGFTPAHPFLRPAWEASEQAALDRLVEVFLEEHAKAVANNGSLPDVTEKATQEAA